MTEDYREGPSSRFFNKRRGNNENNDNEHDMDPALTLVTTTSSKRPRRSGCDQRDQPLQQQPPPQTRRMRRMIDGTGCGVGGGGGDFVGSSSRSALFSKSRVVTGSTCNTEIISPLSTPAAAPAAASLPSLLKLIEREESSSGSSSSSRISGSSGSIERSEDSVMAASMNANESPALGFFQGFPKSKSESLTHEGVGHSSSSSDVTSCGWVFASVQSRDDNDVAAVDENELGHRMSYLQMRGYDQALLDLMDESIFEESSDEYLEQQLLHQDSDKVEREISYAPCDPTPVVPQPVVVTPERL